MWGQVFRGLVLQESTRIIPTRVGTSKYPPSLSVTVGDHPHACGDKDANTIRSIGNVRIIPTRVGTSYRKMCCETSYRDHPHACGDKSLSAKLLTPTRGSSPRVWGQVQVLTYLTQSVRIIPTRVGTR